MEYWIQSQSFHQNYDLIEQLHFLNQSYPKHNTVLHISKKNYNKESKVNYFI